MAARRDRANTHRIRSLPAELDARTARGLEVPPEFVDDGCTGVPDRVPTPRGWCDLRPACRHHDWHYYLLRRYGWLWTEEQRGEFKSHADLAFKMRLIYALEPRAGRRAAVLTARGLWLGVRVFGGLAV